MAPAMLQLHDVLVNLQTGAVLRSDHRATLTGRELALLRYLAENRGRTISHDELLERVFGFHAQARTRVVATTLRRLRVKLGEDSSHPAHIVTVYGEGVRFEGNTPSPAAGPAPLLGRAGVLAQLLRAAVPVVLMTGPGGVGKSAVAQALLDQRTGWLVDLSGTQDLEGAEAAIATAAGMVTGAPLAQQLSGLPAGWIVLDHTERLPEALRERLPAWVSAAPHLQWMVVSRQRRPLLGPHTLIPLPPLSPADALALLQVRLPQAPVAVLERVVEQTEGLPLSLELAASRARLVGADQLADHLDAAGVHTLGNADTSVHASVQRSLDLLPEAAAAALHRLACIPGSFSMQTAAVLSRDHRTVELLHDANLLVPPLPSGRLRLYNAVREVVARSAAPDALRAVVQWAAVLGQDARRQIRTPAVGDALRQLEQEWDLLLCALDSAALAPAAGVAVLEAVAAALELSSRRPPPPGTLARLRGLSLPPEQDTRLREALAAIALSRHDTAQGLALLHLPLSLEGWRLRLRLRWLSGAPDLDGTAQALALAAAGPDRSAEGRITYEAALSAEHPLRSTHMLRAMTLLEAAEDHPGAIRVLAGWGHTLTLERRPRAGAAVLCRAETMLVGWPPTQLALQVRLLHAQALLDAGDHALALQRSRDIHADAVRWGIPLRAVGARALEAAALHDAGDIDEAAQLLSALLPTALRYDWHTAVSVCARLALASLLRADVPRVLESITHLLQRTATLPPESRAMGLCLGAGVAAAAGAVELAQDTLGSVVYPDSSELDVMSLPIERALLRRTPDDAALRTRIQGRLDALHAPDASPEGSPLACSYTLRAMWQAAERLSHPPRALRAQLAAHLPALSLLLS